MTKQEMEKRLIDFHMSKIALQIREDRKKFRNSIFWTVIAGNIVAFILAWLRSLEIIFN